MPTTFCRTSFTNSCRLIAFPRQSNRRAHGCSARRATASSIGFERRRSNRCPTCSTSTTTRTTNIASTSRSRHDAGPEALYARTVLLNALQHALDELPPNQRDVFVAHELEGRSFKEMAAQSGVTLNTLLARKRYAVLHLRARLQPIYDELDI